MLNIFVNLYGELLTTNPIKREEIDEELSESLCNLIKNNTVKDWVGIVNTIGIDENAGGRLRVVLIPLSNDTNERTTDPTITLSTLKNSYYDNIFQTNTAITPGTKLYKELSELEVGDIIQFSGNFISIPNNDYFCIVSNTYLDERWGLVALFKFTNIKKLNVPESKNIQKK